MVYTLLPGCLLDTCQHSSPAQPEPPQKRALLVVLLDASKSASTADRDQRQLLDQRCAELAGRLHQRWGNAPLDRLVLATGDSDSKRYPRRLMEWATLSDEIECRPFEPCMEGDRQTKRAKILLQSIDDCKRAISLTNQSPIYQGFKTALDALAERCRSLTRDGVRCAEQAVAIHSDFLEDSEPLLQRRIKEAKPTKQPADRLKLDLSGIEVLPCGLAQTQGDRRTSAPNGQVVSDAWAAVFGTQLKLDPYCPLWGGVADLGRRGEL